MESGKYVNPFGNRCINKNSERHPNIKMINTSCFTTVGTDDDPDWGQNSAGERGATASVGRCGPLPIGALCGSCGYPLVLLWIIRFSLVLLWIMWLTTGAFMSHMILIGGLWGHMWLLIGALVPLLRVSCL